MTQNTRVLAALTQAGDRGLTAYEALQMGCGMRLAARIADLKAEGHPIASTIETVGTARVARYRLVPPAPSKSTGDDQEALSLWAQGDDA